MIYAHFRSKIKYLLFLKNYIFAWEVITRIIFRNLKTKYKTVHSFMHIPGGAQPLNPLSFSSATECLAHFRS